MKKLLIIGLLASITASGCATSPTYQHAGRYQLFANISKGPDSKYHVDNVSNEKGNVDLNNVTFPDSENTIDCRRVEKEICKSIPEFYRKKREFPKHELGGGLGVGMETGVSYDTMIFSEHRFLDAVAEALLTSKVDRDRILSQYDAYVDRNNKSVNKFSVSPEVFETLVLK